MCHITQTDVRTHVAALKTAALTDILSILPLLFVPNRNKDIHTDRQALCSIHNLLIDIRYEFET